MKGNKKTGKKLEKFGKIISGFLIISCFLIVGGFHLVNFNKNINVYSESAKQTQLKNDFVARQQEIENKKNQIISALNNAADKSKSLEVKKISLSEEIATRKAEIQVVSDQIKAIEGVILEIQKQQVILEENLNSTRIELGKMLLELQKEDRVPMIQKLLDGSLADGIKRVYNLSKLNTQIQEIIKKIEGTQIELDKNLKEQKLAKEQLNSSKALLQAKESSLQILLEQTKGEQAKYDELVVQFNAQKEQTVAQLQTAQANYEKELKITIEEEARIAREQEAIRARAEAARQAAIKSGNGTVNTSYNNGSEIIGGVRSGGGNGLCAWEVNPPFVPSGFFSMPSRGYISNPVSCAYGSGGYQHDGLDIASSMGTNLVSVADGVVARKGAPVSCIGIYCNGGFGNYVIIEYVLPSGGKIYGLYAHMQSASPLSIGQYIAKGGTVGSMGCTGNTAPFPCGVHLHFMFIDGTLSNGISCIYSGARCINPSRIIG